MARTRSLTNPNILGTQTVIAKSPPHPRSNLPEGKIPTEPTTSATAPWARWLWRRWAWCSET